MVKVTYQITWSTPDQGNPTPPKDRNLRNIDTLIEDLCKNVGIPVTQPLITPAQAAQLLLLREQTLAKWRCCQPEKLPFIKSGRLVRYRVEDIAHFILDSRVTRPRCQGSCRLA